MDTASNETNFPIGKKLLHRKESVCVAESVTAGLLQHTLSAIPDAALFFQGGITAYNLGQKARHLKVEPLHAQEVNCVSQQVAEQMALSALELFAADWSIAVTGYASPVPASANKLFAFYAIAHRGRIRKKGKLRSVEKDPQKVQEAYVNTLLKHFAAVI